MKKEVMISVPTVKKGTRFIKSLYFLLLIIIICLISIWIGLRQFRLPEVKTYSNSNNEYFSAEKAMEYLEIIAVKPRPIGSLEHDRVRDYLVNSLTDLGVSPEIQVVSENLSVWGVPFEGKVENIVARITGKDSSGTLMITSHYDSESNTPGAADAGAGVAAILETVRVLKESEPLKNDVIILISDGEEIGLLGAQAFVQEHPWAKDVDIVLNFEARGSSGPSVLFETNEKNERMVKEFARGASNPVTHSFIYDLYKILPNDTDFSIYKSTGMYGLNFGFFEGIFSYHTLQDTVENLNLNSLQHHGDNMLDLVRHFGNMELVAKEDGKNLYFNVIGKKVITYSEKLVLPLMVFSIILFFGTLTYGFLKKKSTMLGVFLGLIFFVLVIMGTYFSGGGLLYVISFVTGLDLWTLVAYPKVSNPIFIFILTFYYVLIMAIYLILLKKFKVSDMVLGGLTGWLMLTCISSVYYPGSSYIFVWPLLNGIVGLNIYMYLKEDKSIAKKIISLFIMVLPIVFTAPVLYLAYTLLTLQEVSILTAFSALLIVFMVPALRQVWESSSNKSNDVNDSKKIYSKTSLQSS